MIPTLFPNYWIFDVTLYAFMNECKTKTTICGHHYRQKDLQQIKNQNKTIL